MRFAFMATLFPSATAAAAMVDLNAVITHYNVPAPVWTAFTQRCGDPGNDLRMLGALPPQVIVAACQAAQLPTGDPLTAIQASQIGLVFRLARRILHLQAGGVWEEWVDTDPWSMTMAPPTSRPSSSAIVSTPVNKERKLKMAQVLDQGDDTEFTVEPESMRSTWLQGLRTMTGGLPPEEEGPTIEQLSALLKKTAVMDMAPYADFGGFVPYGSKALKESKFRTYVLTSEGYTTKELQGPANFTQWRACYRVYQTALLMLDIADLAVLHNYEIFMERLVRQFPTCWHLIYAAEHLARSSHSTRMKMLLQMDMKDGKPAPKGWDEARPWNSVFRQLPFEEEFWRTQVYSPALTWLAHGGRGKVKTPTEQFALGHLRDGLEAVSQEEEKGVSIQGDGEVKKDNKARREARKRRRLAEREELETLRRQGGQGGKGRGGGGKKGEGKSQSQKCYGWNNGNGPCANLPPGQECVSRVKREHKCTVCGSPGHPSKDCTKKGTT